MTLIQLASTTVTTTPLPGVGESAKPPLLEAGFDEALTQADQSYQEPDTAEPVDAKTVDAKTTDAEPTDSRDTRDASAESEPSAASEEGQDVEAAAEQDAAENSAATDESSAEAVDDDAAEVTEPVGEGVDEAALIEALQASGLSVSPEQLAENVVKVQGLGQAVTRKPGNTNPGAVKLDGIATGPAPVPAELQGQNGAAGLELRVALPTLPTDGATTALETPKPEVQATKANTAGPVLALDLPGGVGASAGGELTETLRNVTGQAQARGEAASARATVTAGPEGADGNLVSQNTARVARGLRNAVAQQSGSLTLRLTPMSLGTVKIQLAVQGSAVQAQLSAETPQAQQMLSQQITQLRSSLEAQGLTVERLTVQSLSNSNASQFEAQDDTDGRSRGQQQQGFDGSGGRTPQNPGETFEDLFGDDESTSDEGVRS